MNCISIPRNLHIVKNEHLRDRQIRWVDAMVSHLGVDLSGLARAAGVATSTLTRWRNSEKAAREGAKLSANTLDKLVALSGWRPYEIPKGRALAPAVSEAYRFDGAGDAGDAIPTAVAALTGGSNSADSWVLTSRALELRGYLPGDIVVVDRNRRPKPGDIVRARIVDDPHAEPETVFRVYQSRVLTVACTEQAERASQPFVIDDRVEVEGVVVAAVRPPRTEEEPAAA